MSSRRGLNTLKILFWVLRTEQPPVLLSHPDRLHAARKLLHNRLFVAPACSDAVLVSDALGSRLRTGTCCSGVSGLILRSPSAKPPQRSRAKPHQRPHEQPPGKVASEKLDQGESRDKREREKKKKRQAQPVRDEYQGVHTRGRKKIGPHELRQLYPVLRRRRWRWTGSFRRPAAAAGRRWTARPRGICMRTGSAVVLQPLLPVVAKNDAFEDPLFQYVAHPPVVVVLAGDDTDEDVDRPHVNRVAVPLLDQKLPQIEIRVPADSEHTGDEHEIAGDGHQILQCAVLPDHKKHVDDRIPHLIPFPLGLVRVTHSLATLHLPARRRP
mmetsp:Transcript_18313/g.45740  ORF Transcript_18313/g.45740 Transcript_18313/m.45740 type:complete len:326 (+) Transcript_18313:4085-5062(+)